MLVSLILFVGVVVTWIGLAAPALGFLRFVAIFYVFWRTVNNPSLITLTRVY